MKPVEFKGRKHKVFELTAFGEKVNVICEATTYRIDNTLAVILHEVVEGEVDSQFATLTVNIQDPICNGELAYVKTWSENEWAEDFIRESGIATYMYIDEQVGFSMAKLYDFNIDKFYEE